VVLRLVRGRDGRMHEHKSLQVTSCELTGFSPYHALVGVQGVGDNLAGRLLDSFGTGILCAIANGSVRRLPGIGGKLASRLEERFLVENQGHSDSRFGQSQVSPFYAERLRFLEDHDLVCSA
jgi:hypothetical protein